MIFDKTHFSKTYRTNLYEYCVFRRVLVPKLTDLTCMNTVCTGRVLGPRLTELTCMNTVCTGRVLGPRLTDSVESVQINLDAESWYSQLDLES